MKSITIPKLSLIPDKPTIAPIYEPVIDFEQRQKVAHSWQYTTVILKFMNKYFGNGYLATKNCAATLSKENNKWIPALIEDK